jgi:superfamily II DNA/RNA helicase
MFLKKMQTLSCILFVGGVTVGEDLKQFETNGGNIIVGTAGRLEDLFTRTNLKLNMRNNLKTLVIIRKTKRSSKLNYD